MKKENIYVVIDSEEKRLRALQILSDAGELVYRSRILDGYDGERFGIFYLNCCSDSGYWQSGGHVNKTEITLDQLDQLLNPNYAVKEVHLTIDELKAQAESLGFELVKKERKPKVGDFGVFWDWEKTVVCYDFILKIEKDHFEDVAGNTWKNFRHLTEEEKQQIQNNW